MLREGEEENDGEELRKLENKFMNNSSSGRREQQNKEEISKEIILKIFFKSKEVFISVLTVFILIDFLV